MGSENRLPHGTPNSNRSSSVSKKMVMTGLVSPILDLPQPNHYESLGAMVAMVAMSSKSLCLSLVYLLVKKWRTGFPYWIMLDYYNSQYMKGSLIPYNIYIYIDYHPTRLLNTAHVEKHHILTPTPTPSSCVTLAASASLSRSCLKVMDIMGRFFVQALWDIMGEFTNNNIIWQCVKTLYPWWTSK